MPDRAVDVVVQVAGRDVSAGHLWVRRARQTESATFTYLDEYLADPDAYALEPALPLVSGPQQTGEGRELFASFSDCAPDRWGRLLLRKQESLRPGAGERTQRSFGESDYLLGVRDDLRQGALRFATPQTGEYLAAGDDGVPAMVRLPALLAAAERLERDEAVDADYAALFRAGPSLGGARPKAHVLNDDGRVAIAKFPSPKDEWDVMRWEFITLQLAEQAGITVPHHELLHVDGRYVLLLDRFDRDGGDRVGYVSAMTLLEMRDGDQGSYLDIADAIEVSSTRVTEDLRELWRRIVFTILVSNTDDHLRNHGFLRLDARGWSLSPAFDINPNPEPGTIVLSTAISEDDAEARLTTLTAVAPLFRLGADEAAAIIAEVHAATRTWREAARSAGMPTAQIERMAPAFEHEQAELAADLSM